MSLKGKLIMKMTLYEILGVVKTATYDEIRHAYRGLSKMYHTDNYKSGSRDQFAIICQAHDILTNSQRRERYDRTGDVSEGLPEDHMHQVALGLISQAISRLIGAEADLRTADLKSILTNHFDKNINALEEKLIALARNKERAKSIAGRWKTLEEGPNVLEDIVNTQFDQLDKMRENFRGQIQANRLAIEILNCYDFKRDDVVNVVIYADSYYGES